MKVKNEVQQYLSRIGRKGGSTVTPRKVRAARQNGRKGGRPRKEDNYYVVTQSVQLKELTDEPERFDFLKGLEKQVSRIDEAHPNEEADDYYIFLIWLKLDTDEEQFIKRVNQNFKKSNDWSWKVLSAGTGFVTVHTWI